jgi:hypothetical protein
VPRVFQDLPGKGSCTISIFFCMTIKDAEEDNNVAPVLANFRGNWGLNGALTVGGAPQG